ncbi:hypothetical protein TNCV_695441 [Trichonephila clavipes]|nr:hypothetical protein TNCV_695441 [Trichonephila clavipes]
MTSSTVSNNGKFTWSVAGIEKAREPRDRSEEDYKRVTWSYESLFPLLKANERLIIWCQAHEAMDPVCEVGTVQGHGGLIIVWAPCTRGFCCDRQQVLGPTDLITTYSTSSRIIFGGIGHQTQTFRSGVQCSNH